LSDDDGGGCGGDDRLKQIKLSWLPTLPSSTPLAAAAAVIALWTVYK